MRFRYLPLDVGDKFCMGQQLESSVGLKKTRGGEGTLQERQVAGLPAASRTSASAWASEYGGDA
jgi:hypothetical protein